MQVSRSMLAIMGIIMDPNVDHPEALTDEDQVEDHVLPINTIMQEDEKKDEARQHHTNISVAIATCMARNPTKCMLVSLLVVSFISIIAFYFGDFRISVDNKGWRSRGTLISKREMQRELVVRLQNELFYDTDGSVWEEVENNVLDVSSEKKKSTSTTNVRRSLNDGGGEGRNTHTNLTFSCDSSELYSTMLLKDDNLFAVYKAQGSRSILDPEVLFEICEAETKTHEALIKNDVCSKCGGECLPPVSLVWILRLKYGKLNSTCDELQEFYTQDIQEEYTDLMLQCTSDILKNYDSATQTYSEHDLNCPPGFQVSLVDTQFGVDNNNVLKHSSSYFFTYSINKKELFKVRPEYAMTDKEFVSVAYDNLREDQNGLYTDKALLDDMFLAMTSIGISNVLVSIHTKSIWLTFIGNLQIIFSLPLAYFVYYFITGLRFFPFLNFMGLFVASALGVDDIFVAVDKWKNVRLNNQSGSTEDIAAVALPDAASAMLLTTSTTAVAFFATCICPVAPIFCFAVFCGLMIVFNYVLNMLLVFPALCLYDIWLKNGSQNCFINFGYCGKSMFERRDNEDEDETIAQPSLIHRILGGIYFLLHKFRYVLLAASLVATGVSIYFGLKIKLPDSADVRMLKQNTNYELHFAWKKELLSFPLFYSSGSAGLIIWGLIPADTGVKNNPDSLSKLCLDESFDASSNEAQTYMLNFCEKLFDSGLASPFTNEYKCTINEFGTWLRDQNVSVTKDPEYISNCNGATSLPMAEDQFDSCIIAWSELTGNKNVLSKGGKVTILRTEVKTDVKWDAPFIKMEEYWKRFENYMEAEREIAPGGVNGMFQSSSPFWWYDTNVSMLQTAIGAALIAIGFASIIALLSSRSLFLSLFAIISITYVLAATTSSLVGFGWSLGFLESICFAILVGISCDFVIHLGHAYGLKQGNVSKHERTKYAIIHMGPSILAAALTTFSASIIMLFCQVVFFTKFALILSMTILHATIGSFIVYLVLTDCFGPSEPTKFIDSQFKKLCLKKSSEWEENPEMTQNDRS